MNFLEAIVLLLLALSVVAGARAGFLGPVLGLAGAVAGFGAALALLLLLPADLPYVSANFLARLTELFRAQRPWAAATSPGDRPQAPAIFSASALQRLADRRRMVSRGVPRQC